jgi:acyl-CoA thioester hydrolase
MSETSPGSRFTSEVSLYVRYAETDAMGIVHHASYIVYLEEGRSHYARERGQDYAAFEKTGYYLSVAEVHARYARPARYGQRLRVRTWIEEMRSRSLTFAYEVADAETGLAHMTATTRHVCITHDGRVALLPDAWRAWDPARAADTREPGES